MRKVLIALAASAALVGVCSASASAQDELVRDAGLEHRASPQVPQSMSRASRSIPRIVRATPRDGVRRLAGVPIPRLVGTPAPTLADFGRKLGRPRSVRRVHETCDVRWRIGATFSFTTFGFPGACRDRPIQLARLVGKGWTVYVGTRRYRIGMSRSKLPKGARRIRGWNGGGLELATMPFVGRRTTTVMAHVNKRKRVNRFVIFVGGGGD